MSQSTLTQIRVALAAQLAARVVMADGVTPLRTVTTRFGDINPPCVVVLPEQDTFATYQVSMDGQVNWRLRIIVVASPADSQSGQDILDPFLEVAGPQSIWAAVRADPTLGGAVSFCSVTAGSKYGLTNFNAVDYLTASLTAEIGD